jgi:hypothetical protein
MAMIAGGRSQFDCALGSAIRPARGNAPLVPLKLWWRTRAAAKAALAINLEKRNFMASSSVPRSYGAIWFSKEDRIDLDQSIPLMRNSH